MGRIIPYIMEHKKMFETTSQSCIGVWLFISAHGIPWCHKWIGQHGPCSGCRFDTLEATFPNTLSEKSTCKMITKHFWSYIWKNIRNDSYKELAMKHNQIGAVLSCFVFLIVWCGMRIGCPAHCLGRLYRPNKFQFGQCWKPGCHHGW